MNEYIENKIVEQLKELNKKNFKTEVSFITFWIMGCLFTLGFVPEFLDLEKLTGFWNTVGYSILAFLFWPVALGDHLNILLKAIGQ